MSTQSGETWLDGQSGMSGGLGTTARSWIVFEHCGWVRYTTGITTGSATQLRLRHIHVLGCLTGINFSSANRSNLLNVVSKNNGNNISGLASGGAVYGKCVQSDGCSSGTFTFGSCYAELDNVNYRCNNNAASAGLGANSVTAGCFARIRNLTTANNVNPPLYIGNGEIELANPSIGEATPTGNANQGGDGWILASRWNGVANDHRQYGEGANIFSDASTRHTASGLAWKCSITATNRGSDHPARQTIAKIACTAGVAKSVQIWARRDNTNINGLLMVRGGQVAGIPETSISINPSTLNTWEQSSALTFTPTEDGVVEVEWHTYDGVGTTNNFWVDDVSVS